MDRRIHIPLLAFFIILCGMNDDVVAGTVKCPRYSVTVEGTAHHPNHAGYSFRSLMQLNKIGSGAGYDGKWHVIRWEQESTYPHRIDHLPIGPQVVAAQPQLGGGQSMNCIGTIAGNKTTNICTGGNFVLEATGGKFGDPKTQYWFGEFKGNLLTIRFDKNNPIEPDRTGTVSESPSEKIDVTIQAPKQNAKFVYSVTNPGTLTIKFKAKVSPPQYAKQLKWNIPEIKDSKRTMSPASGEGPQVDVTYEGLPPHNSDFGRKTATATLDVGACKADDSSSLTVFFPRDAKNHPGGDKNAPNWFHYWSQTKAKVGPATYGGTTGRCASGGNSERLMGYYRNEIFDSKYTICDLKNLGPSFFFKSVEWTGKLPNNRTVSGIDTFAAASHHENAHYEHFTQWWKKYKTQDKFQDTNKNRIKDTAEQQLDKDKDLVPDSLEPGYGMDPTKKHTLGAGVDDEELICWKAESSWKEGSADKNDWAKPGKQWP